MGNALLMASGKGGTGKTQTSINLAYWLSRFGEKVAVVDADLMSSNLLFHLNVPPGSKKLDAFLLGNADLKETGYWLSDNLKIIPGEFTLTSLESLSEKEFRAGLHSIFSEFDFTLVDCPPGIMLHPEALYKAADRMILVSNAEPPAITDSAKTLGFAQSHGVHIEGLILNRLARFKEELRLPKIGSIFSDTPLLGKIPEDSYLPKATSIGEPVSKAFPLAPSSRAFKLAAMRMLGLEQGESLSVKERFKILMKRY